MQEWNDGLGNTMYNDSVFFYLNHEKEMQGHVWKQQIDCTSVLNLLQ